MSGAVRTKSGANCLFGKKVETRRPLAARTCVPGGKGERPSRPLSPTPQRHRTMPPRHGHTFRPRLEPLEDRSGPGTAGPFLFGTEDGTISGWDGCASAMLKVDNSASGTVYKGLALAKQGSSDFLYAADFNHARVDVFNSSFQSAGTFTDPALTAAGFAPFGIQNIGGNLFVTFAKQDAAKHDDVAGRGNGFVDLYDTSGNLIRRVASGVPLNSPWGLAIAPSTWGRIAGDLLVGNFGDGAINVFDPVTGDWRGGLKIAETSEPLRIDGLWGLRVGNGGSGGDANSVFFTAGPDDE